MQLQAYSAVLSALGLFKDVPPGGLSVNVNLPSVGYSTGPLLCGGLSVLGLESCSVGEQLTVLYTGRNI